MPGSDGSNILQMSRAEIEEILGNQDAQNSVLDKDLSVPPLLPNVGDRFIVAGPTASDDWQDHEKEIAEWTGLANKWRFFMPKQGFQTWVEDEEKLYIFYGMNWTVYPVGGGGGGQAIEDYNFAYQGGLPPSTTDFELYEELGINQRIAMSRAGTVISHSIQIESALIAGTLTAEIVKNGTKILSALLTLIVSAGQYKAVANIAANPLFHFDVGDEIGVMVSSSAGIDPHPRIRNKFLCLLD